MSPNARTLFSQSPISMSRKISIYTKSTTTHPKHHHSKMITNNHVGVYIPPISIRLCNITWNCTIFNHKTKSLKTDVDFTTATLVHTYRKTTLHSSPKSTYTALFSLQIVIILSWKKIAFNRCATIVNFGFEFLHGHTLFENAFLFLGQEPRPIKHASHFYQYKNFTDSEKNCHSFSTNQRNRGSDRKLRSVGVGQTCFFRCLI